MVTEKFKRNKLDAVHTTLGILLHVKIASGHHSYNLVSVVEHFGGTGSGHYIVYRRVIKNCGTSESYYWDGVSDSQVCMVSEEDVLFLSFGNLRAAISVLEYNFEQVGVAALLYIC
ncbi:hypothetical protein L6452_09900 [Arctium lappa]|uniref:Uncharacterized protein n=1 Tax=Arctium lappa TaxID=4217 RepID=A0ACB9DL94_ARCLA|nr:hypothetical protein L6452_09900 [Arctium lappa]